MTAPKRTYPSNELREAKKTAKAFGWGLWKFHKSKTKAKGAERGYYIGPQLPAVMDKPSIEVTEIPL